MGKFFEKLKDFTLNFIDGYGFVIVKTVAILIIGLLIVSIVRRSVKKTTIKSRRLDNSASSFITSMATIAVYVLLMLVIIGSLGFSTTGVLAMFSSVILAIALGMQNTLASLTNGIVLIFTKPFRAGDFVDIGGTPGTVKEVKLVTPDNLTVIVPNSEVLNSVITNYSSMPLRRLDVIVPLQYSVNVSQVKGLVQEVIVADERIVNTPQPFFRLTEYGASSLNFTLRAWSKAENFWAVKFDVLENILETLRANGIEIPFNQLDVRVVNDGEKEGESHA